MGPSGKDPLEKKSPSAKSLQELVQLLLKLNSRLREKLSPRSKKESGPPDNVEMLIIILNRGTPAPKRAPKPSRAEKPKPPKDDWIETLCDQIERG